MTMYNIRFHILDNTAQGLSCLEETAQAERQIMNNDPRIDILLSMLSTRRHNNMNLIAVSNKILHLYQCPISTFGSLYQLKNFHIISKCWNKTYPSSA